MPKWPYRILGTAFDRVFRNDLNANFNDVADDVNEQKSRVDNLIINAPQPSEVVDLRVDSEGITHPVARDRFASDETKMNQKFDQVNADLAKTSQKTDELQTTKANKKVISSFGGLAVGLEMAKSSIAIQVLGDSTGNDTTDWVYLLSQYLATKYPNWNIQYRLWSDTNKEYLSPVLLNTSVNGLTRIGGGSQTRIISSSLIKHTAGDLDVRVKLKMPSWKPSGIVTPISRFGGVTSEKSWYFSLLTDGKLQFVFTQDGTTLLTAISPMVTTFSNGEIGWIRVHYDYDNETDGYSATFYQSSDGISWIGLDTVATTTGGAVPLNNASGYYELGGRGQTGEVLPSGAEIYEIDIKDGFNGESIAPRMPDLWEDRLNGFSHAVSGAPTLTIVNGSHPGANINYLSINLNKMTSNFGQAVIMVSDSHNEGGIFDGQFRSIYSSFIDLVSNRFPNIPIVAIAQNPQASTVDGNIQHDIRRKNIFEVAKNKNLEVLDVYSAFMPDPLPYLSDGVHPNEDGSALWRDVVINAIPNLTYFAESAPIPSDIQTTLENHTNSISDHATKLNNHETTLLQHTDELAQNASKLLDVSTGKRNGDLSTLLQKDGVTTVITGDSLSYNRYDFDPISRANAYDCFPGMLSWAFMLRDTIHRNDESFKHADELEIVPQGSTSTVNYNATANYTLAFNGRYAQINIADGAAGDFTIYYKHNNYKTNKAYLYLSHNPNNHACSFDIYVNDVFVKNVNNNGEGKLYQGFETLVIDLPTVTAGSEYKITFKNLVQTATIPDATGQRRIYLYGIGSKNTPVYLTGAGGQTSTWLLSNLQSKVLNYNPDVVVITIGANDRVLTDAVTYKSNLTSIISQIIANKPTTQIVLVSPPSSRDATDPNLNNASYVPDSVTNEYVEIMKEIAIENECYFLDTVKLFAKYSIADWRYDNVHYNRYGNDILAKTLLSLIMPESIHDKKMIDSNLYFASSKTYKDSQKRRGHIEISYNSATGVYDLLSFSKGLIKDVVKINAYTIRVNLATTFSGNYDIPVIQQYGAVGVLLIPRFRLASGSYVEFNLGKGDWTLPDDTYMNANANSFKFIIKF